MPSLFKICTRTEWSAAEAAGRLGASLRWEPSRGGALFPHLYGDLPVSAVLGVTALP